MSDYYFLLEQYKNPTRCPSLLSHPCLPLLFLLRFLLAPLARK